MFKRYLLGLVFICFAISFHGQLLRVGLFPAQKFTKIKLANATTNYYLIADTNYIGTLDYFSFCEITKSSANSMDVVCQGQKHTGIKNLKIIASSYEKSIELSGISPVLKARAFEGDFEIKVTEGRILVVNLIDLETYLEGVVESEAGTGQRPEYYKVQAVISRTFALGAKQKHAKEGFNLCNQVHCQAYLHKRNGGSTIDSAVSYTHSMVLLSADSTMAPTFFSANCGGQTCDPSDVWYDSIKGLTSFKDTFCIYTKQAHWTKKISKSEWNRFLVERYRFPVDDSLSQQWMTSWSVENRTGFFIHPGYGIPMRDLREKFDLKSAYFGIKEEGEYIVADGKGYGHGVGLCQEGAMKMAKLNYTYQQILGYYFPDFKLQVIPQVSF